MEYKQQRIYETQKKNFLEAKRYRMTKMRDEKFCHAKEKFKTMPYGMKEEVYN